MAKAVGAFKGDDLRSGCIEQDGRRLACAIAGGICHAGVNRFGAIGSRKGPRNSIAGIGWGNGSDKKRVIANNHRGIGFDGTNAYRNRRRCA